MERMLSMNRIKDYEPHDGVFGIDEHGDVFLVPFAFLLENDEWVTVPDECLPAVLEALHAANPDECIGEYLLLASVSEHGG